MSELPIIELLAVAQQAGVLQRMAAEQTRIVTVDYCPPREGLIVPRDHPTDDKLEAFPPTVITLTYLLDDAMFGGVTYVALTCEGRVLIHPFVWESFDKLAEVTFNVQAPRSY